MGGGDSGGADAREGIADPGSAPTNTIVAQRAMGEMNYMLATNAGATQGTTTKTGPEDPAHDSQVPEMTNKVNKCQFDQIAKRRNFKRSLLKCVDAMSQRKVLLCPCPTILGVCD